MTDRAFGPVKPTDTTRLTLTPASGRITGGLWAERRRVNRDVSVPAGWDRLHEAGNFHNMELAAGRTTGDYVNDLPFLDSDLYKWLEGVAWVLADPELDASTASTLRDQAKQTEELLRAAQAEDGYLDSHFQVRFPGERFVQLPWGHELYCAGHLIQAAVAMRRTTGDEGLLEVARRVADLVVSSFGQGEGKVDGVCGHPEIETALVELYRETGEQSYLDISRYFIDRRGHGLLGSDRFGRHYWQDHVPVRDAPSVEGHSVRQLYLLAGVADLYAEDGDESLRQAAERLWAEMTATKTYLTGGIGAHHRDEAFGDPYELPNERSYCETCAAISSIMFSQRMLMITGEAKYADLVERTLYNGFLGGLSLDGGSFIYANPLQVRDGHLASGDDGDYKRVPWFRCACCPPNVMRTLGSLDHYVVLAEGDTAVVHQYLTGDYDVAGTTVHVQTDYPWDGRVTVTADADVRLRLRVPHWAEGATLDGAPATATDGWLETDLPAGGSVELLIPLDVRFTTPDPRVDAARGCVAIERGPLVYCIEGVDHDGRRLDDLQLVVGESTVGEPMADLGAVLPITLTGRALDHEQRSWWPYGNTARPAEDVTVTAVPYYAWGNRGEGAMRVWIPTA